MTKLFELEIIDIIQGNLLDMLNNCYDFNNPHILNSPRAVGDAVQEVLGGRMKECFPLGLIKNFNDSFARRAMADIAFMDFQDNYFVIDVKTHNRDTNFNMPNLVSVERLSRFYEDDKNYFVVLLVEYKVVEGRIKFDAVRLMPIEHLKWDCLTIGALGWGQIQIANAKVVNIEHDQTRKGWMLQLCDALDVFYPKEISKIESRLAHFEKVRKYWESKQ